MTDEHSITKSHRGLVIAELIALALVGFTATTMVQSATIYRGNMIRFHQELETFEHPRIGEFFVETLGATGLLIITFTGGALILSTTWTENRMFRMCVCSIVFPLTLGFLTNAISVTFSYVTMYQVHFLK